MEIMIIVWLACAILCATVAEAKRRSAGGWFITGLLTGIFGLIAIAGMPAMAEKTPAQLKQARANGILIVILCLAIAGLYTLVGGLDGNSRGSNPHNVADNWVPSSGLVQRGVDPGQWGRD